jgi:hypothetical protein
LGEALHILLAAFDGRFEVDELANEIDLVGLEVIGGDGVDEVGEALLDEVLLPACAKDADALALPIVDEVHILDELLAAVSADGLGEGIDDFIEVTLIELEALLEIVLLEALDLRLIELLHLGLKIEELDMFMFGEMIDLLHEIEVRYEVVDSVVIVDGLIRNTLLGLRRLHDISAMVEDVLLDLLGELEDVGDALTGPLHGIHMIANDDFVTRLVAASRAHIRGPLVLHRRHIL